MAIDPNIALSIKPVQIANPLEQYMQVQQIQQTQNQNRLADLMYSNQQRDADQAMQLNEQYKNAIGADGNIDRTKLYGGIASAGLGSKLPAIQKQFLDTDTAQANLKKVGAETGKITQETTGMADDQREKKRQKAIVDIAGLNSPQDALASLAAHEKAGDLTPEAAAGVRATIPQNPADFPKWQIGMLQRIMSAGDALKQLSPDANTVAKNNAHLKGIATQQAGENARAAESRKVEIVKADPFGTLGLNKNPVAAGAGGGLSGEEYLATLAPGVAAQVKAMSEGRTAITPMTIRTPQGQALLQMAMQYEPGTDQTTYIKRAATAKDAASGKLATSNNALNTVAGHLAALADSADALHNTSFPWVNKVKNFVSSAAGNPQVKEFNLNLNGVADELERAYRGAGGSEGSIKLWRENLGDANSPEQFKGVLSKGAEMLQSKLEANQEQYSQGMSGKVGAYRTITPKAAAALAKLRGTTANDGQAPISLPATNAKGWTLHTDANGNRAYVSPDGKSYEEVK